MSLSNEEEIRESEGSEQKPPPESPPLFAIDIEGLARMGRSFEAMVASRMCAASQSRFGSFQEATVMREQAGRVIFESKAEALDALREIENCCAQKEGFITPTMPLLEAVFRIILGNGNRALTPQEIVQKLRQHQGTVRITAEVAQRLMDHGNYYGLRRVTREEAIPVS